MPNYAKSIHVSGSLFTCGIVFLFYNSEPLLNLIQGLCSCNTTTLYNLVHLCDSWVISNVCASKKLIIQIDTMHTGLKM